MVIRRNKPPVTPQLDLRAHALGLPCAPGCWIASTECTNCGWKGDLECRKGTAPWQVHRCPTCGNRHSLIAAVDTGW